MTTSCWERSRRGAAAASAPTVIAVVAGAVLRSLGVGVPHVRWPHTGQAFAADTHTGHRDLCARIIGSAKCERGAATIAAAKQDVAGGVCRMGRAGAGVAALVVWWRSAAGQGRH